MATRKTEASLGAQCTGTMRSRWVSDRCSMFTQLARWTETPWPWVTKPRISSPGTGVQHLDSRTQTSATPSTSMPESLAVRALETFGALARDRGDLGQVLLGARRAADRADQAGDHRLGADPALADRGVQAGEVGVAELRGDRLECVRGHQPLQRQALLAHDLGDLVLARLDRRLAALLGEPLADLVAGAGGLDEVQPVAVRPASWDLEVKISTVSPLSSVDSRATRRPLTRAPIVRCPTSVWIA